MDGGNILGLLDSSGEISELAKSRKWNALIDLCDKKIKKGNARDAWQVKQPS